MFKCGWLAAHWYTQILKDHQNLPLGLIHLLCILLTMLHSWLFTKMPKSTKGVNLWKICIFTLLPCQQPNVYKLLKNTARVELLQGLFLTSSCWQALAISCDSPLSFIYQALHQLLYHFTWTIIWVYNYLSYLVSYAGAQPSFFCPPDLPILL